MNLGTYQKQTGERTPYSIYYSDSLSEGDYILTNGVTAITTDPTFTVDQITVLDDTTETPNIKQARARFFVSGGTDRTTVKVTIIATTADGEVFEDEIIFKVKDL